MNQDPTPSPLDIDPESAEALAALAETRQRIAEAPANVVVVNHVMGLYELAAIHLSAEPPRLQEAALAIDAVACSDLGAGEVRFESGDVLVGCNDGAIVLRTVQMEGKATSPASEWCNGARIEKGECFDEPK